ncbi:uncharacterized protein ACA1_331760, partial [Acanthamoeba castellanii str. Neff]
GNPLRTTTRTTTTTEVTETTEIERRIIRNRSRSHSNPDPPNHDAMEMSHQAPQSSQPRRPSALRPVTRLRSQSTPTSGGWVMHSPVVAAGEESSGREEEEDADAMHLVRQPQQKGKMDIGFLVSA